MAYKQKTREIYETLPRLNCGLCGFGSCGQFARAVAEGRASPFGCKQNPWSGHKISEIMGAKVPTLAYRFQPVFAPMSGIVPPSQALREQVQGLSQRIDNLLTKIESLKRGKNADQRGRRSHFSVPISG